MVRAIHRRKREFVFTAHGRFGAWMGRHVPGLVHLAVTRTQPIAAWAAAKRKRS